MPRACYGPHLYQFGADVGKCTKTYKNTNPTDADESSIHVGMGNCLSIISSALNNGKYLRNNGGIGWTRHYDPGIQRPRDPDDPVTLFYNELQMSTYV